MKSLARYKKIIKAIFWATILLIVFLTLQAIYETDNWEWFNIDFNKRAHIISAYGSLIGGVLAFLSILFVLYQVYEQREQIIQEKRDAENDKKQDLKDRLILLKNYIINLEKDIIEHGKSMESFYKSIQKNPLKINTMLFNANKTFAKVTKMDILLNFKAFQLYFRGSDNWQKLFLDLYKNFDFYIEEFKDLRKKYRLHIKKNFKKQEQIGYSLEKLSGDSARLVDDYRAEYGDPDHLNYPWCNWANDYILKYHGYLKKMETEKKLPDFGYIDEKLLSPFIEDALEIRDESGFDKLGSRNITEKASTIRKRISEVKADSIHYSEDIEKHFKNYFAKDNKVLKELNEIKELIDEKLKLEIKK